MINVSIYQKGDIYKLQDMKEMFKSQEGIKENVEELRHHPNAHIRTISDVSGIIAVVGLSMLWAGTMEIWSVTGNGISKHPISYVKTVRKLIDEFSVQLKIHRIQSACICGDKQLEKWFECIGFQKESVMKKFGPDRKDYFMYARIN